MKCPNLETLEAGNEVAIIGMACRFPEAEDYLKFWKNLAKGKNSIREIPPNRWELEKYYSPDFNKPNKSDCKWAGLLPDIDLFDNHFFSISPREANNMDPHQRLLLEETVHCIEDSSVSINELREKKTSVFAGVTELDYYLEAAAPNVLVDRYACLGNFPCFLANRISYGFGFSGQSMSLDAACASSLTAIHEGKRSLITGECDYAIAASACLISHPWKFISFSKARALSPDGECKTFDKDANGFVPGEGVGVLLLQRLDDALKAGNHIFGIIKGSAVNHGGKALSLPSPKVEAQRQVILAAYEDAQISPESVTYVEAHGTGTSLGDPVEIEGLTQAFRQFTGEKQFCKIGSVKTNIGHLGPAAGMASVIKVLLMMRYRKIPASLNVKTLNPAINFENTPFSVATSLSAWESHSQAAPFRAGISSFGIGGSNSHLLLESYPNESISVSQNGGSGNIFILSAKSKKSLEKMIAKWKSFTDSEIFNRASLQDISMTLLNGREHFPFRYGFYTSDKDELAKLLSEKTVPFIDKTEQTWYVRFGNLVLYNFDKSKELLTENPLFSRHLDGIKKRLADRKNFKKIEEDFFSGTLSKNDKSLYSFLLGYSFFRALRELGFMPDMITGEGDGLWISLTLSGMMEPEDAVALLSGRKEFDQVKLNRPKISFYDSANEQILRAYHFDESYLLLLIEKMEIGHEAAKHYKEKALLLMESQQTFKKYLEEWNDFLKPVNKEIAQMLSDENLLNPQGEKAGKERLLLLAIIVASLRKLNIKWNLSEQRVINNGRFYELLDLIEDEVMTKEILIRLLISNKPDMDHIAKELNERQKFLNIKNSYKYIKEKNRDLHEIQDISSWIKKLLRTDKTHPKTEKNISFLELGQVSSPAPEDCSVRMGKVSDLSVDFKNVLLQLWLKGVDIEWHKLDQNKKFRKISLPGYCFDRRKFWRQRVSPADQSVSLTDSKAKKLHPMINCNVSTLREQKFKTLFLGDEFYLADHIVRAKKLLPGVACIEMARVAGELSWGEKVKKIQNIVWARPLFVTKTPLEAFLKLFPGKDFVEFEISTNSEDLQKTVHSHGRLFFENFESGDLPSKDRINRQISTEEPMNIMAIKERCRQLKSGEACYKSFRSIGINYGRSFQTIQELLFNEKEALSILELDQSVGNTSSYFQLHPSIADAAIQTAISAFTMIDGVHAPLLPFALGEIELSAPVPEKCFVYIKQKGEDYDGNRGLLKVDIFILDESGWVLTNMKDLSLRAAQTFEGSQMKKDEIVRSIKNNERVDSEAVKAADSQENLKKTAQELLKKVLSREAEQPVEEIDSRESFENFGIDSVMILNMTEELEKHFGDLSKTLFFEYKNISSLADYFVENHKQSLVEKADEGPISQVPGDSETEPEKNKTAPIPHTSRFINYEHQAIDENKKDEEIAIIGLSGRYPMAKNLEEFWSNLKNGKDCISEIPKERWDYTLYYDPDKNKKGTIYSKWGGFLDDIDKFDPLFFNISPKEAELIDPQERLFLETACHVIEDAGYTKTSLDGVKVGVYVGVMWSEYQLYGAEESLKGNVIAPTSQIASIANRVSYFFNFQGPSIGVDTMCSSSLTAIHLACESLRSGNIDIGIAGGVNLSVHPSKYIFLSNAKFAASDGRCRSFGKGGDGYVPGEGVGAVFLKPFRKAIEDEDHIYAVIKGSAINHGGKTNSYTVPNPQAQSSLILDSLKKSKVDPRTISYLEAHGTGTSLGDPIEINGVSTAFKRYTKDTQFCPIGSVKSNIGHLESAAGIAGLTKVLLQMKYKQLVPSIHSEVLNGNINFIESPFYVQRELTEWKQPVIKENGLEKSYLRRAGISTFGAGGSNAHIVLEEFETKTAQRESAEKAQVIVLSAKKEERLKIYAREMAVYLSKEKLRADNSFSLENIAYTLQTAREPMNERLAVIVSSIEELIKKFTDYYHGKTEIKKFFRGSVKKPEIESLTNNQKAYEDLDKQARFWTSGVAIDWKLLYPHQLPKRISLPPYPFARESYWVPKLDDKNEISEIGSFQKNKLHPLIDSNTSTLRKQEFTSLLSGNEFLLSDHQIDKEKILPGVAFIEMARAAGELAGETKVRKIENIMWVRPVKVDKSSREVILNLIPNQNYVEFEFSSGNGNSNREINAKGNLVYENKSDYQSGNGADSQNETVLVDIDTIKQRCEKRLKKDECYSLFDSRGLHYGPAFQAIDELRYNRSEVLAALQIPEEVRKDYRRYILHPSLMDGALQAVIGLTNSSENLEVPFSMGSVEIVAPLPERCYAYVKRSDNKELSSSKFKKYDITMLDGIGRALVKMKDLSLKSALLQPGKTSDSPAGNPQDLIYFQTEWSKSDLKIEAAKDSLSEPLLVFDNSTGACDLIKAKLKQEGKDNIEIIKVQAGESYSNLGKNQYILNPESASDYQQLLISLGEHELMPGAILHLWSKENHSGKKTDREEKLKKGIYSIFFLSQALLKAKPKKKISMLFYYSETAGSELPLFSAVGGFARTLRKETPFLVLKTIGVAPFNGKNSKSEKDIIHLLLKELEAEADDRLEARYDENGERWVTDLKECSLRQHSPENSAFLKERGVYLITGGAGGLGLIFAKHLAGKYKATLILTGRSDLNSEKESEVKKIESTGSKVLYFKADVSDKNDVEKLISEIKTRFKKLDGVIHSAGVIRDSFLLNKSRQSFEEVIKPKVYGTLLLDEATQAEKLDFFVLFSSITSVIGNIGQCDYAYGNSFMDHIAETREGLRIAKKRSGRTISINWPLWREGGMTVSAEIQKNIENRSGLKVLETEKGIVAFEKGLSFFKGNFLVVDGDRRKIMKTLGIREEQMGRTFTEEVDFKKQVNSETILKKIEQNIVEFVSRILKVRESNIDLEVDMSEFGFDSISFTELAARINKTYDLDVTPAIFFEYPTIGTFTGYLYEENREKFLEYFCVGLRESPESEEEDDLNVVKEEADLRPRFEKMVTERVGGSIVEPVAIIGMSGLMPHSDNLDQFWKNLEEGKDLVSEVPKDRWDWRSYYGDPMKEAGKTNVKWGGFMRDVDKFDNTFFSISPREAELMDPQQRIFLETVWKTIEDAGYKASDLSGSKTGIFAGVAGYDYSRLLRHYGIEEGAYSSTGLSHSILANRISFLLNLHGPSEPVDTACSSSLVAVHRGVEAIRHGRCDMAIAGGVNVLLDPMVYVSFSKTGMLSEDGRCKTFDEGANGYVRGEGCGALLLKPLSKAEKDGDHIYGVIKGTSQNHGGHVNSLTAPNPNAQADVLIDAYERAGIDPSTVTYIETHGTGTSIGDPIEINGLKKAFEELYKRNEQSFSGEPYCGLGSVKTNIGHLETSAGIAGMIKVLLAMKHEKLPATIHFKKLNPYIKLKLTPFYIVTETMQWKRLKDSEKKVIPYRAGVSSFGFGGVNAHVVLEEYKASPSRASLSLGEAQLAVLSAKTEDRLKIYVEELLAFLRGYKDGRDKLNRNNPSFTEIVYTLQTGREAMEARLAVLASSVEELIEKLTDYFLDKREIKNLYKGNINKGRDQFDFILEGEEGNDFIKILALKGKLVKLAKLWVLGAEINWKLLYPQKTPNRVSLPTYLFEKKKFWFVDNRNAPTLKENSLAPLHSMIDSNQSTLEAQLFRKEFKKDEFYIRDHVVGEKNILPGVVHLEIVRASGNFARLNGKVKKISDLVWVKPVEIGSEGKKIDIYLYSIDGNKIGFELFNFTDGGDKNVYSQGKYEYGETPQLKLTTNAVDISSLKKKLKEIKEVERIYEKLDAIGLHYGRTFQTIKALYKGEGEILSKLVLPDELRKNTDIELQPSVLDGALQSISGFDLNLAGKKFYVPFSLGELEIINNLENVCYAHVKVLKNAKKNIKNFNINIYNEAGNPLVVFKNFDFKAVDVSALTGKKEGSGKSSIDSAAVRNRQSHGEGQKEKLQNYLTLLVAEALKVKKEDLSLDENLNEYGLDSLSMMEVVAGIEKICSQEMDSSILLDYQTIDTLTNYLFDSGLILYKFWAALGEIKNKVEPLATPGEKEKSKGTSIDIKPLHRESESTDNQSSLTQTGHEPGFIERKNFKYGSIFLTGSTGVLGSYILRKLLITTKSKVYCLIRAGDNKKAVHRLKNIMMHYGQSRKLLAEFKKRVIPVTGDITLERLGMPSGEHKRIAQKIDVVIHSAALTNLYLSYRHQKPVNVTGVKRIIDFALESRQKYLMYISSYSIMGDLIYNSNMKYTERDFDIGQGFSKLGYQQSKFEGEGLVREASNRGLMWDVVRPGNILGDSKTGAYPFGMTGVTGIFYEAFEMVIKNNLAAFGIHYFDISPVDFVAKATLFLALKRRFFRETYNLVNPQKKKWYEIVNLLIDFGYKIEVISSDEYMDMIQKDLIKYRDNTGEQMMGNLLKYNFKRELFKNDSFVDADYTSKILKEAGIVCPKIDLNLLSKYLFYYASINRIPLPPGKKAPAVKRKK